MAGEQRKSAAVHKGVGEDSESEQNRSAGRRRNEAQEDFFG